MCVCSGVVSCCYCQVALEAARSLDDKACWDQLANAALAQGNHQVSPPPLPPPATPSLKLVVAVLCVCAGGGDGLPAHQEL